MFKFKRRRIKRRLHQRNLKLNDVRATGPYTPT